MSILEVSNVSKSFGGVKANVDISMNVEKGKIVGLIGPNGSGKTTLMKMIIDLHRPQKGNIYIDSVNVKNIDNEYLRNKVMYVNQRTLLFDKSVIYNIKYGNENISDDKVIKLIQKIKCFSSTLSELQLTLPCRALRLTL